VTFESLGDFLGRQCPIEHRDAIDLPIKAGCAFLINADAQGRAGDRAVVPAIRFREGCDEPAVEIELGSRVARRVDRDECVIRSVGSAEGERTGSGIVEMNSTLPPSSTCRR
jgi:hypothetical protein